MSEGKGMGGWLKTALGGLAGLCSGAILMYLTPLVNSVVKPATPLANFETRRDGLAVTFHNLSTGPKNVQGWWDFGDGSALEPVVPDREEVTHTYQRPGDYTVKLSLRNSVGEANERSVTLQLDTPAATTQSPQIRSLDVVPLSPEQYAPATFRVATDVHNAQFCVWDLDANRPLEVNDDPANRRERLVTFERPGHYVIKLAAFNGTQHDQRSAMVDVRPAPSGCLTAVLTVTDRATGVERAERAYSFGVSYPPDQPGSSYHFNATAPARSGYLVADVRVQYPKGAGPGFAGKTALTVDTGALSLPHARNLTLQREADGKAVRLTGDLVRAGKEVPPGAVIPVVLVEERRRAVNHPSVQVMASLCGTRTAHLMLPPLPRNWVEAKRDVRFELREGNRVVWQGTEVPHGVVINLTGRRCIVNGTQEGEHVHLTLRDAGTNVGAR